MLSIRQAQFALLALYFVSFFLPVGTSTDSSAVLPLFSNGSFLGYRAALGAFALMTTFISMGPTAEAAALLGLGAILTSGNLLMLSSLFFLIRGRQPPKRFKLLAALSIVGAVTPLLLSVWSTEPTKLAVGYYLWGVTIVCRAGILLWASKIETKSAT